MPTSILWLRNPAPDGIFVGDSLPYCNTVHDGIITRFCSSTGAGFHNHSCTRVTNFAKSCPPASSGLVKVGPYPRSLSIFKNNKEMIQYIDIVYIMLYDYMIYIYMYVYMINYIYIYVWMPTE